MEKRFKVCPTTDIEPGEGYSYTVNDRVIGLFNVEGTFYAIDDACPHMGVSLTTGHLDGCVVTCPLHAWRFNVTDGTWCDNPRVSTDSWPVTVEDGMVFVTMAVDSPKEKPSELAMMTKDGKPEILIGDFQQLIHKMYFEKDQARGVSGTFMWLMEEIGELSSALRSDDRENLAEEFADVFAWLVTIANVAEIDLSSAVAAKYGAGCPGCGKMCCVCPDEEKP